MSELWFPLRESSFRVAILLLSASLWQVTYTQIGLSFKRSEGYLEVTNEMALKYVIPAQKVCSLSFRVQVFSTPSFLPSVWHSFESLWWTLYLLSSTITLMQPVSGSAMPTWHHPGPLGVRDQLSLRSSLFCPSHLPWHPVPFSDLLCSTHIVALGSASLSNKTWLLPLLQRLTTW